MSKKTKEPRYAIVDGYWKDDKSEFRGYIIKLSQDVNEAEDDKVFFYVNGEHNIKEMVGKESIEDFVITDYELTHEI